MSWDLGCIPLACPAAPFLGLASACNQVLNLGLCLHILVHKLSLRPLLFCHVLRRSIQLRYRSSSFLEHNSSERFILSDLNYI